MGMKARKKRTWRWVTSGDPRGNADVWPAEDKPYKEGYVWRQYEGSWDRAEICAAEWRRLFGIALPTDRPIRVEFTARLLPEDR